MLAVGWRVSLPYSCFAPGYIFLQTEVVTLDTVGLCLGVWHWGKWALCPSAQAKSNPGHGLMGIRTTVVPLFSWFSFCPSSVEHLLTYNLSAGRSWERERYTSAQGASLGSGTETTSQLPDQFSSASCRVQSVKGFAEYSCPVGYLPSISRITCPGLLIFHAICWHSSCLSNNLQLRMLMEGDQVKYTASPLFFSFQCINIFWAAEK